MQFEIQPSLELTLMIVGFLIFVMGFFVFILGSQRKLLYKETKKREEEAIAHERRLRIAFEHQESERRRLAKEVLDGIGASLQALRNTVYTLTSAIPDSEKREIYSMIEELTEKARSISWELMPPTIERFGLTNTTREFCKRMSAQFQLSVTFIQEGISLPIDVDQQLLLYRIVQEGVMNALHHAQATHVEVKMLWLEGALSMIIEDNGKVLDYYPLGDKFHPGSAIGLSNLENRVYLLHATFAYQRNKPSGSILSIKLPIYGE